MAYTSHSYPPILQMYQAQGLLGHFQNCAVLQPSWIVAFVRGRMIGCTCMVSQPRKAVVLNHGLHSLRTMVLNSPSATTSRCFSKLGAKAGIFRTMLLRRGRPWFRSIVFSRVGTMQVQAIIPSLILMFSSSATCDKLSIPLP